MSAFDAYRKHSQTMQASFAAPNPLALQGIYQAQVDMLQQLGNTQFAQIASESIERLKDFSFGECARRMEALRNKATALFSDNRIRLITDVGELQQAPEAMIPYIMAIPEVYEMYLNGELEGYEDKFIDIQPGAIGVDNFHYRQMTHGIVQTIHHPKHGEMTGATTYHELHQPENPLDVQARMNLEITRKAILHSLEGERDPTSPWNNLI